MNDKPEPSGDPLEQPPAEQPPAEQPPAEQPPAEQPPAEQPRQPQFKRKVISDSCATSGRNRILSDLLSSTGNWSDKSTSEIKWKAEGGDSGHWVATLD